MIDWQSIINKHGLIVWQTTYRLLDNHADAADCFQETFICALKTSQRQRVRNFPALLIRLATAQATDQRRRRFHKSRFCANKTYLAAVPSSNPGPAQQLQTQELAVKLREALAQLPQQEAEVFCLRYFNDMSYRQIAKTLGIKKSTTGVLLHRARTKLRSFLEVSI